ncbi:MAG: GHKL domain-containing protein [Clostridia bacterium]|nr:GHKL domain-containing protein [Clostridia bacterium]
MIDFIIELGVNAIQATFYIGFLYLFFDKKYDGVKNILSLVGAIIVFFTALYFITFHIENDYIKDVIQLTILVLYVLLFLKGNRYLKILMAVVDLLINAVISLGFSYIVTVVTNVDMYYLINYSSGYRYFCILIINLLNIGALWVILALFKQKEGPKNRFDFIASLCIPILSIVIVCSMFLMLTKTNPSEEIYIYYLIVVMALLGITVFTVYMIKYLGKQGEIEKQLELSQQREALYKEGALRENAQIEALGKAKHDISNKLRCIHEFQSKHNYDEASKLCKETMDEIASIYTPLETDNSILNAIVNVKLEKANSAGITCDLRIKSDLKDYYDNYDIISIVGNLCDNAIEYLSDNPDVTPRTIELNTKEHMAYYIITCSNPIKESVLENNPELKTTKEDTAFHGKGVGIINSIAEKYGGRAVFQERDGWFLASAFLLRNITPEECMAQK